MKRYWKRLLLIILITALAGMVAWPHDVWFIKGFKIHPGLDLKGGTHLVYKLDTNKVEEANRSDAINGVVEVMERRVNEFGLTEPIIQRTNINGADSIIIQLPGVQNVEEAKNLIGKTAKLDFRKPKPKDQNQQIEIDLGGLEPLPDFELTDLTGSDLKKATVVFAQNNGGALTGSPQVQLEFNSDGAQKFKDLTTQFVGQRIAIYLDDNPISAPVVQTQISDGTAIISGDFTVPEAKQLAIQLNAGALPVPVELIEERTIGATLGEQSVQNSLIAGVVGLLLVALFMILYYRWPGFLAVIALAIYLVITMAIFEWWAITITLAGIAGLILSIGMAVDANILIFERLKEENVTGKPTNIAVDDAFKRAMSSVWDSNMSSLITAVILYFTATGLVKNFAVTLSIGIIVSLFSAIYVTRTFMNIFYKRKHGNR